LEFFIFQNEVRADIFSDSLAVFQSERVASAGGRKGGLGGIPPALQILGEISSNFFESTPPVEKGVAGSSSWFIVPPAANRELFPVFKFFS